MSNPNGKANLAVAFIDLATLSNLGRQLYGGEQVATPFAREIRKSSWFTHVFLPMKVEGQVDQPSYKISKSADFLLFSWLIFHLPDISVKAGELGNYKICYCRNPAHNLVKEAALVFNDLTLQSFDTSLLDQTAQFTVPEGKWDSYQAMIGNKTKLITPGSHLAPETLKLPLKFTYTRNLGSALPTSSLTLNDMRINCTFEDDLTKIIRVQNFDGTDWLWIDPATVTLSTLVDVVGKNGLTLTRPELWGRYAIVTNEERAYHQSQTKDMVIEQIQKHNGKREAAGVHRMEVHFTGPIRALFFAAHNHTSSLKNNHSNYTTNDLDLDKGIDPIRDVTLTYEGQTRYENVPGSHFNDMEPYQLARRCPKNVGYHGQMYCLDLESDDPDGSSNYGKLTTTFDFNIVETSTDSDDPATTAANYSVQIRALSTNIIRISEGSISFPSFN